MKHFVTVPTVMRQVLRGSRTVDIRFNSTIIKKKKKIRDFEPQRSLAG